MHPDEIAVTFYSGLSFIKIHRKDGSTESNDDIELYVATEKYLDCEFVNKVCEYALDKIIAAIWDCDRYYVSIENRKLIPIRSRTQGATSSAGD